MARRLRCSERDNAIIEMIVCKFAIIMDIRAEWMIVLDM